MVPGIARILDSVGCWRFQLDGDGSVEDGAKESTTAYFVRVGERRRADRRGSSAARTERIRGLSQNLWVAPGFGSCPSVWQGDFQPPIRAKAVRLSPGQFRFVVEALHDGRGNLAARVK